MTAVREDFSAAHEVHWNACSVFGGIPDLRVADIGRAGGNGFLRQQRALFPLRRIANDADRIRERFSFEEDLIALGRRTGDPKRLLRVDGNLVSLSSFEIKDADLPVHSFGGE